MFPETSILVHGQTVSRISFDGESWTATLITATPATDVKAHGATFEEVIRKLAKEMRKAAPTREGQSG